MGAGGGASEGLGAAFADDLAARGMNLVLIARRGDLLDDVAQGFRQRHGGEVRRLVPDLADAGLAGAFAEATNDIEVGVLVYNAAFIPMGPFAELDAAAVERVVRVNALGPATLVHALLPSMRKRGRGGIVPVSSLAGLQGTPGFATYAATKAFNTILAEGLWAELRASGFMLEADVVARRCLGQGAARRDGASEPVLGPAYGATVAATRGGSAHWGQHEGSRVSIHVLGFFTPWLIYVREIGTAQGLAHGTPPGLVGHRFLRSHGTPPGLVGHPYARDTLVCPHTQVSCRLRYGCVLAG